MRSPTGRNLRPCSASDPSPSAEALLGTGFLAFTVDQGGEQNRHQGIVAIEGGSLAEMALHYFATSEQLRCQVHLACAQTASGWRAGALILEKVAGAGGIDPALNDDGAGRKLAHRDDAGGHADRPGIAGRRPAGRTAAVSPVPYRGGGRRPRAGAVVRLPLLPRAPRQHPGGLSGRGPGSYGDR